MNLFNEAIYKNHLEHAAAGTKWGKHKYLYITPSGRYVYPEDVQNGAKNAGSKISNTANNVEQKVKKIGQGIKASYEAGKKASTAGKPKTSDQVPDKQDNPQNTLDISDLKNMQINTDVKNRADAVKNIALRFLRGDYGEGDEAKKKLGKYYNEIIQKTDDLKKSGVVRDTSDSFKKLGQDVKASYEDGKKAGAAAEIEKKKKQQSKQVKHYDLEEGLFLKHWGKKRRSGRYAFGSGDRPYQHEPNKRYTRKNSSFSDRRRMTDEELLNAITRAKREVDLYRAERDNRSQGQRFVEDVLNSVGKAVIIGAATGGLKYAGRKFVESALGDQELSNAMFGGGGGGKKKNKHKD